MNRIFEKKKLAIACILLIAFATTIVIAQTLPDTSNNLKMKNPYSAVFSMIDMRIQHPNATNSNIATNYTFYLPVSSYVNIESTGHITTYGSGALVYLSVDNPYHNDEGTQRVYSICGSQVDCRYGFQTSRVYYLTKGNHIVYLRGGALEWGSKDPDFYGVSITATANQRGKLEIRR